ncbi:hypothetical protein BKA56DRAFT_604359 [Ilyonectria sp. MPI-CAGE-AT-0026]|nr:hypothetical protein BKA56DRAFT_604359 [Ilyonectria sp. MPI-CAGE-AT-0026]
MLCARVILSTIGLSMANHSTKHHLRGMSAALPAQKGGLKAGELAGSGFENAFPAVLSHCLMHLARPVSSCATTSRLSATESPS